MNQESRKAGKAVFLVESPTYDRKTGNFQWVEVARYSEFKSAQIMVERNAPKIEMRIRGEWPREARPGNKTLNSVKERGSHGALRSQLTTKD